MANNSKMIRGMPDTNLIMTLLNIQTNETVIEQSYIDIPKSERINLYEYIYALSIFLTAILLLNEIIRFYKKPIFPSPFSWFYYKVKNWIKERYMILPFTMSQKAKSSPFISPMLNLTLPNCSTLDEAEKGRNVRNRSLTISRLNNFKAGEPVSITAETKVTIFTMVGSAISPRTEETIDFKISV